jgi:RimJ/RimL family protein N-acetyltransferase
LPTNGPTLETERLQLKWFTLADTPLMYAIWNDPAFMRFVGDRGIETLDMAETAMCDGPLHLYETYGYGPFRVTRRSDGTDAGVCGLYRRENLDAPDLGFAFLPDYRGMGFGYESSRAVLLHAHDELELATVTAIVSPKNTASIGLLRKLGLVFEKTIRMPGEDEDVGLYSINLKDQENHGIFHE